MSRMNRKLIKFAVASYAMVLIIRLLVSFGPSNYLVECTSLGQSLTIQRDPWLPQRSVLERQLMPKQSPPSRALGSKFRRDTESRQVKTSNLASYSDGLDKINFMKYADSYLPIDHVRVTVQDSGDNIQDLRELLYKSFHDKKRPSAQVTVTAPIKVIQTLDQLERDIGSSMFYEMTNDPAAQRLMPLLQTLIDSGEFYHNH